MGLEPTTPCLQSRPGTLRVLAFFAFPQVTASTECTLIHRAGSSPAPFAGPMRDMIARLWMRQVKW